MSEATGTGAIGIMNIQRWLSFAKIAHGQIIDRKTGDLLAPAQVRQDAFAELAALRARCETAEAERDMLHAALDAYDAGRMDYARGIARDAGPFDERDVHESWEHGWDRSAAEARVAELTAALNAVCNRLEGDTIRGYHMHISAGDRDALEALAGHAGDAADLAAPDGG